MFPREPEGDIPQLESHTGERIKITHEWVLKTLLKTNITKSCGPDELHPTMLKELAVELAAPMTEILNQSLFLGEFPEEWKMYLQSSRRGIETCTLFTSDPAQADDCDNLQSDWKTIYNWALYNNMFLNSQKFHYVSYSSSLTSNSTNAYVNPDLETINPANDILDLGIFIYADCSFEYHIKSFLRTLSTRDITTMLTLFKSLVLSRLDYSSQLWSPYLVKHIDKL